MELCTKPQRAFVFSRTRALENQIIQLNSEIKKLNERNQTFSPDFNFDLYRTSKTKRRGGRQVSRRYFNLELCTDGIHPTPILAKAWLMKFTLRYIKDCWKI